MADVIKSFLSLGLAATLGFGVGRASVRTGESRSSARGQAGFPAKKTASARKKRIEVRPTHHQAPAIPRSLEEAQSASVKPGNAVSNAHSPAASPMQTAAPTLEPTEAKKPSPDSATISKAAEAKPTDTDQTPPKVRLFNAYRTRTFWTAGAIPSETQDFTVFIEREEGKSLAFKPRIDWQVGGTRGTVWGDSSKKTQMLRLPPEAWRLDRPTVEVELTVGAAMDGQDFLGPTEKATVVVKSLAQALGSKGGLIHFREAPRQAQTGPGWVTSWNKVSPGAGTTTLYVAPGTNTGMVWALLASASDFKIEPGVMAQGNMEIFASRDQVLLGVVAGKIPPLSRSVIQQNRDVFMSFRGQPQDYLGALQGDATSLAERVKTRASGDTVVLFRNVAQQPFGAVKRDLITVPNIQILRKEGIALFTKAVENPAYFAH